MFLAVLVFPLRIFAIGQLVQPVVLENVRRGQVADVVLTLLNSESGAANYNLEAEGDIKDWVTFFKKGDFEKSITDVEIAASSYQDAVARFTIPESAPNGRYDGFINLISNRTALSDATGKNAGVRQMVARKVSVSVTGDEAVDVVAYVLPVDYRVGAGQPLKIVAKYDNRGNVDARPDLQVKVLREGMVLFNAIFPYPENEPSVKPLSMATLPAVEWPTAGNPGGTYNANVKVLLNGKTIKESNFTFQVSSPQAAFMASLGEAVGKYFGEEWFSSGMALFVLAIIVALVLQLVTKKYRLRMNAGSEEKSGN
jgi:hypothetical protein